MLARNLALPNDSIRALAEYIQSERIHHIQYQRFFDADFYRIHITPEDDKLADESGTLFVCTTVEASNSTPEYEALQRALMRFRVMRFFGKYGDHNAYGLFFVATPAEIELMRRDVS